MTVHTRLLGGAACYPKYTKSFGDAPPRPPPLPAHPTDNARQIDDSIEP